MKTTIAYENDKNNERNIWHESSASKLSLEQLRKRIKSNLKNDNKYVPFTKEWEWDECCNHNVE